MQVEVEPAANSLYPFVLTEEQEHLRREIREFAAREIAPNVAAWDEASEFPLATVKSWAKWGCWASSFPHGVWRRGAGLCGLRAGY
jgi:alkylation response protein AidB-like acyl-CoA dehydrogenase